MGAGRGGAGSRRLNTGRGGAFTCAPGFCHLIELGGAYAWHEVRKVRACPFFLPSQACVSHACCFSTLALGWAFLLM